MDDLTSEGGLRERKRLAAMRRIQEIALDLFDREGYNAVTIERIAAEAEVSPSSVYRYFGTKEQIVLWDEYDPVWITTLAEEIKTQPVGVALRHAVEALASSSLASDEMYVRRRTKLFMEEPEIEAASAIALYDAAELIGDTLSRSLGRPHGDLDVQLLAHALVGAVTGAIHHWYESDFSTPMADLLARVLDSLEHGFVPPIDTGPA